MHWLAYGLEGDRVAWLRVIKSPVRPNDVNVINNGFGSSREALALMGHYLRTNEAGFLTVPPDQSTEHMTRFDRIALAFHVEPFLFWGLVGAYGLIGLVLLLLLVHVI